MENGASPTWWRVAKSDHSWRGTLKLAAKTELLESFFQNCICSNGGFECLTRWTLTKNAPKPSCWDRLKWPFCVQKRLTLCEATARHCDFNPALTRKSRPFWGTFARANQAVCCMTLQHCAQRSTPWLLVTPGCDRNVECFSLFER